MAVKKAKREDNRFQVSLDLGRDADGKRIRKYFYGATQKEANKKKSDYLRELEDGFLPGDKSTVGQWLTKWESIYLTGGYSNRTTQQGAVKKLRVAFGNQPIKSIAKSDIQQFASAMAKYSETYVNKIKGTTIRVFQDAQQELLIIRNPCNSVNWEHQGSGTHRAIEPWERDLITNNWNAHPRAGVWVMLMLYAGLRRGEALALRWEDVDFKAEEIHVRVALHFEGNKAVVNNSPKTLAGIRDVPLLEPLKNVLLSVFDKRTGPVCKTASGTAMTKAAFREGWTSYRNTMTNVLNGDTHPYRPGKRNDREESGPKSCFLVRPHDLRHTYCTMLYDAGVDIKSAQYLMGHADAATTMKIYTHLSAERKASSADILRKYAIGLK